MTDWEILDARWRVRTGCYYVTLCNDIRGRAYVARFCMDPVSVAVVPSAEDPSGSPIWSNRSRVRGVGHSTDLYEVKRMCEDDARLYGLVGKNGSQP
jgi:hypothetical protein